MIFNICVAAWKDGSTSDVEVDYALDIVKMASIAEAEEAGRQLGEKWCAEGGFVDYRVAVRRVRESKLRILLNPKTPVSVLKNMEQISLKKGK